MHRDGVPPEPVLTLAQVMQRRMSDLNPDQDDTEADVAHGFPHLVALYRELQRLTVGRLAEPIGRTIAAIVTDAADAAALADVEHEITAGEAGEEQLLREVDEHTIQIERLHRCLARLER